MASTTIGTNFVKQFGSTLELLAQTKGGKFDGKCLEESIEGEEKYFDQLDAVYASEVVDRYGDSPENDITHARRRVVATPYDVGLMLDRFDKVQMLTDPESQYVQQINYALQRKKDIEFIKGALGTAYTGKAGATGVDLDATNSIGGAAGDAGAGLTIERVLATRTYFEENDIDLSDPMNKPYMVVAPKSIENLLSQTEVTSADYNSVKALVNGELNTWCGFEFIMSNLLPYCADAANQTITLTWSNADVPTPVADNIRANFAYVKSGMRRVVNPSISVDIEKRGDKRFNWYAYGCMRTGAVRMEEKKVAIVASDEEGTV
jgi:hypothetical protein